MRINLNVPGYVIEPLYDAGEPLHRSHSSGATRETARAVIHGNDFIYLNARSLSDIADWLEQGAAAIRAHAKQVSPRESASDAL